MNSEQEIRSALTTACQQRGKQAEIAAAFEVHASTVKRWIEGAEIPPPVQKLLRLYLFQEIPFGLTHEKADLSSLLQFDAQEYRLITLHAERAGQAPAAWIRSQILAYLAFHEALEKEVALPAEKIITIPRIPLEKTPPILRVADAPDREEEPVHWIDLVGGIAAGSQISTDVTAEPVRSQKAYEESCYALRVFGQSMEPKIPDQSTIVVRTWHEKGFPRKGTIVVYSDGFGSTLKEFGYRKARADEDADTFGNVPILRSLNKAFPDVQTIEGGRIDAVLVEML